MDNRKHIKQAKAGVSILYNTKNGASAEGDFLPARRLSLRRFAPLILQAILALTSITANAGLHTLAEIGQPAADFPPGFIYWSVRSPVVGGSGHVAFIGAADVSIGSTAENRNAVWSGHPHQLNAVIKEGESPVGFEANTVFRSASQDTVVVSDSGSVAFKAQMKGANPNAALIAAVDGTSYGVIQGGSHAEGFPAGTNVFSLVRFAFTDAGMAILGAATTGQMAIWFWNNSVLELILAAGDEISDLYPGCSVSPFLLNDLNQAGEILFYAFLTSNGQVSCPTWGLFSWKRGVFRKIAARNDYVPGTPVNSYISSLEISGIGSSINDNGETSFLPMFTDPQQGSYLRGAWIGTANGQMNPVLLLGEELPDSTSELIQGFSVGVSNAYLYTAGKVTTSSFAEAILAGPPKQNFSYPDFSDLGQSHLSLLVHSDFQPPGFDATWYFDTIGDPLLNNKDTVAFWGAAKDALDPNNSYTPGIWLDDATSGLSLVLAEGLPVEVDGKIQAFVTVSDISQRSSNASSTNSGLPNQLNDHGRLVFMGALEGHELGDYPSTVFYYNHFEPDPDCSGAVVTIPSAIYLEGEIVYCVAEDSLTVVAEENESVVVQAGATVRYEAPTSNIVLGRRVVFDSGSVVTVTAPDIRLEPGIRIRQGARASFRSAQTRRR